MYGSFSQLHYVYTLPSLSSWEESLCEVWIKTLMPANIEQSVLGVLEQFPATRKSPNSLLLAYWWRVDGWPEKMKDFYQTTPAESILREAREVWRKRPDLSPTANPVPSPQRQQVFREILELFPATEVERASALARE